MGIQNKIRRYDFEKSTLDLANKGMTSMEISQILTKKLGGSDTISQPTVSRFLQQESTVRKDVFETNKEILDENLFPVKILNMSMVCQLLSINSKLLNRLICRERDPIPHKCILKNTIRFNLDEVVDWFNKQPSIDGKVHLKTSPSQVLTDAYIRNLIIKQYGLKATEIAGQMIGLKREQLSFRRELMELMEGV